MKGFHPKHTHILILNILALPGVLMMVVVPKSPLGVLSEFSHIGEYIENDDLESLI